MVILTSGAKKYALFASCIKQSPCTYLLKKSPPPGRNPGFVPGPHPSPGVGVVAIDIAGDEGSLEGSELTMFDQVHIIFIFIKGSRKINPLLFVDK